MIPVSIAILLLSLPLAAQGTQPATSRPRSRPASLPATAGLVGEDPAARKFLERAAATQLPGGSAFTLRGFRASLNVRVFQRDEGSSRARTRSGEVSWRYRLKSAGTQEGYHRHLAAPDGTEVEVAFFRRQRTLKEKGGAVIDLGDPAYKEDRKQLDNELQQVRQLARLLLLKDLLRKDARVVLGRESVDVPTARGVVKTREILWTRAGERSLSICIGSADERVYQVTQAADRARKTPARTLRFSHHRYRRALPDTGETFERILLPAVVEFLEGDRRVMTATARRPQDLVLNPRFSRRSFRIGR